MTPEQFAPYMARALAEATANFGSDPNGPMNALISGLEVFRDKVLEETLRPSNEAMVPGYMLIRSAITAVMAGDVVAARARVEQYAREFPGGVFARAVTENKVFEMMTLMVSRPAYTGHCFHCGKPVTFEQELEDSRILACPECKNQIFIRR